MESIIFFHFVAATKVNMKQIGDMECERQRKQQRAMVSLPSYVDNGEHRMPATNNPERIKT